VTSQPQDSAKPTAVSPVVPRLANVDHIWQLHGEFGRNPVAFDGEPQPEFAVLETGGTLSGLQDELIAHVDLGFRLTAKPAQGEQVPEELIHSETGRIILAYAKASFMITYSLREGPTLTDEDVEGFCSVNAIHNAWPFWREFITTALTRSGVLGVPVPPYMIHWGAKPALEKPAADTAAAAKPTRKKAGKKSKPRGSGN
jgi:hypothetical protein